MGEEQPFYALQSAGLDNDSATQTLEEMAAGYVAAVRAVQPSGPYRLGGWSLGGLVAFEMAKQLVAAGEPVENVSIFDVKASTANRRACPPR